MDLTSSLLSPNAIIGFPVRSASNNFPGTWRGSEAQTKIASASNNLFYHLRIRDKTNYFNVVFQSNIVTNNPGFLYQLIQ